MVVWVAVGQQPIAYPCLIGSAAILAEFAFANEARDGQAETDDGLEHAVDVVRRRITHRPGVWSVGFMAVAELADQFKQARCIFKHFRLRIGVYRYIVPGRHRFAMFGFAGVERRADIGLFARKDNQRLRPFSQLLALRVGAGQVSVKRAVLTFLRGEQKGHMTGYQTLAALCDEHWEGGGLHLFLQRPGVVFCESARYVHGYFPWRMAAS